jgi:hypothetical protein
MSVQQVRSAKQERALIAQRLRAEGRSWFEVADTFRKRFGVNARVAWRWARGWNQRRVADEWCQRWPDDPKTAKNISTWETWPHSGHAPSLVTLGRLAEIYECDLADLVADLFCYRVDEFGVSPIGRDREPPVRRREFLTSAVALAAGALRFPDTAPHIGASDVERLRAEVRSLYLQDDHHGGGAVYERALRKLQGVRHLLDTATYNSTTGRRLQVVAGELTEHAGWCAFDAGQQAIARQFFTEALGLSDLSESASLKTLVLSSMTLQAATYGRGREALNLVEAAQRAARPVATPKLSSLLAAREALAHARLGDGPQCGLALARAERLLAEGEDSEDEAWLAFWGPADLYGGVASSQLFLAAAGPAAQAGRAALASVDTAYPRNQARYLAQLARALVALGDVDEGAAVACDARSRLGVITSGRLRDDLRALRDDLQPHSTVPAVRDCLDQLVGV